MTHPVDREYVDVHSGSVEYIRLYFTADVPVEELSNARVAFARGMNTPLPDPPEWTPAVIMDDHVQFVFGGTGVNLGKGVWSVYANFTANPESPIERIPGYLRVL